MRQGIGIGLLLMVMCALVGCKTSGGPVAAPPVQYDRPLPPGQMALRKITNPDDLPDFSAAWDDLDSLSSAIQNSLNYLSKPSSEQYFPYGDIDHDLAIQTLETFLELVESGVRPSELNGFIHAHFDVYISVGCDDQGTVLFTGYYTPIFEGSYEQTDRFQYPLYQMPEDLVKGPDGQALGRRQVDGSITTYPDRATIESTGMLKGTELVWLTDPFEAYIAHVQGSAKLRIPDGQLITIGYAANNGHDYKGVAESLVADGKMTSERVSLGTLIDYFKRHPDEVDYYTRQNARFVFFRIADDIPRGSLNEPVTPMRTIATDKSIFPRASLTFISTTLPQAIGTGIVKQSFTGFMLDQDTGGAIRAPGRCDVYMGQGDLAGQLAGQTYQEGRLYYLFLKAPAPTL